jgi:hypothetical protein
LFFGTLIVCIELTNTKPTQNRAAPQRLPRPWTHCSLVQGPIPWPSCFTASHARVKRYQQRLRRRRLQWTNPLPPPPPAPPREKRDGRVVGRLLPALAPDQRRMRSERPAAESRMAGAAGGQAGEQPEGAGHGRGQRECSQMKQRERERESKNRGTLSASGWMKPARCMWNCVDRPGALTSSGGMSDWVLEWRLVPFGSQERLWLCSMVQGAGIRSIVACFLGVTYASKLQFSLVNLQVNVPSYFVSISRVQQLGFMHQNVTFFQSRVFVNCCFF